MDQTPGMDIIARAEASERVQHGLIDDFASRLFPQSHVQLSDRLLANSRLAIHGLVSDLERNLCIRANQNSEIPHEAIANIANGAAGGSFGIMERAGILRDRNILEAVFVHAQMNELQSRLIQQFSQNDLEAALTRNLDHEDRAIADAAMGLLVAQNQRGSGAELPHSELSAEALYALIWKTVAAIETTIGGRNNQLHNAAESMLGEHDEGQSVRQSALRLAHLVEQSENGQTETPHPLRDGLELCLARLSVRSNCPFDKLVQMTAEHGLARFVVAVKSTEIPAEQALSIFASLASSDAVLSAASYNEIALEDARRMVRSWTMNDVYQSASAKLLTD